MPRLPMEIEVSRMLNLVRGFGWVKVKEEVLGSSYLVTLSLPLPAESVTSQSAPPS